MVNKINESFWNNIAKECWEEQFNLKGPDCTLRIQGNSKELLRVWSSIAQIQEIEQLHLFGDEKTECPIDDHELTKLNGITQLRLLDTSYIPFSGSCFATVKNLIHLRTISISSIKNKSFDKFFDWTQNFPELIVITLDKASLFKPNFKNLIYNTKLRKISLCKSGLVDASLKSFSGHPSIFNLGLTFNNITGESLSFIADCPLLVNLDLVRCKLTPKGIATIAKSHKSEFLKLDITSNVGVDDACLKDIATMTNLMELYIDNTSITDKDIMQLCELQFLRCLNVRGTKVSEKAVKKLHKKIPYCYILYDSDNKNKEIAPEQEGYNEHFGITSEYTPHT